MVKTLFGFKQEKAGIATNLKLCSKTTKTNTIYS